MQRSILYLLAFFWIAALPDSQAQADSPEYVPDELIVKFSGVQQRKAVSPFERAELKALNRRFGVTDIRLTGNRRARNTYVLHFAEAQTIPELARAYEATGYFEYVEPNYIGYATGEEATPPMAPTDTYFDRQWGLHNTGSFILAPAKRDADIDMDLAYELEQGSSDIVVAIMDTGVKRDHPEFEGRIWTNTADPVNGDDDDNNGYQDDFNGYDFSNDDAFPTDDQGHGTHVTGILGANGDNGFGYAGVDWNCQLMVLKVLDRQGRGQYDWFADAIYYAADHGARVINMSLGGGGFSNLLSEAVDYAYERGLVMVASMANSNTVAPRFPAAFSKTIAVGATTPRDLRADPEVWGPAGGSNFGPHIDVMAPGTLIYSLDHRSDDNFGKAYSGTSQAAPHVSGLVSLLLAQNPSRTPEEIRTILQSTAEDQVGDPEQDTPGWDQYYGHGRINAYEALQLTTSTVELRNTGFAIYPNPVSRQSITLQYEEPESRRMTMQLFDNSGKLVLQREILVAAGATQIPLPNLPAGIYQLFFRDNEVRFGETLVVGE